jgi:TolB-like protein
LLRGNRDDLRERLQGSGEPTLVRFGIFELDLQRRELRRKGTLIKLQQQPFEILRLLVRYRGEFVSREVIQQTLWPDNQFVDFERSINTAMMKLRQALRESASSPVYIETVTRVGYRLIASILEHAAEKDAIEAIAILPLDDFSSAPDHQFFVDGLTDALITAMAQRSRLRVVSRMTTLRYKGSQQSIREIAAELNVQAIVEGSILRSGDRIRISARLLDAREDRHLWAQTYDRDLKDILLLQQEIVMAIVSSMSRAIEKEPDSPAPKEINPKAYEHFLKGNFLLSLRAPKSLARAIECYQAALALQDDWAPPYAALAEGYRLLDFSKHVSSDVAVEHATTLTQKALSLDPANAQAHATMGAVLAMHLWKWKEGEERIRLALRTNPRSSQVEHLYSVVLLAQGKYDEALQHIDLALAIDHSSLFLRSHRAQILLFARRLDESIRESQDLLEENSEFAVGLMHYGVALVGCGRAGEALPILTRAFDISPLPILLVAMAHAHHILGQSADAQTVLNQLYQVYREGACSPTVPALGRLVTGEREQAFQLFETAFRERDIRLALLSQLALADPVRTDSRFVQICEQIFVQ